MLHFFSDLLGLDATAQTLTAAQAGWRAVAVFLIALVLLRVSGRRTFASNSGQETVVKFMLGAVLSRGIMGDSPFGVVVAAATTLVVVHRLLAYATYFVPALGRLVKGTDSVLAEHGRVNHAELRRASLPETALHAAVRAAANLDDLSQTQAVRLEHDGMITVVKKA